MIGKGRNAACVGRVRPVATPDRQRRRRRLGIGEPDDRDSSSASSRSRWMRAATPHPAIPIRSTDVIMMPVSASRPRPRTTPNRQPGAIAIPAAPPKLRLYPSNMRAVRQEFIRACQDLIFISLPGSPPQCRKTLRILFHRPPAGCESAVDFPG